MFFPLISFFTTVPLASVLSTHRPFPSLQPFPFSPSSFLQGMRRQCWRDRFYILKLSWERAYFNQNFNKISEGYIRHRALEPQWFTFGRAISSWKQRLTIESLWQPHLLASELCHLLQHAVYLTVSVKLNYLYLIMADIFISILNSPPNVSFNSCT